MRSAVVAACLVSFTAGCAPSIPGAASAGSASKSGHGYAHKSGHQPFDPLSITVALSSDRVESGKTLRSRLMANPSDAAVVDPGCYVGTGRYALIPKGAPDGALWRQPIADCGGAFKMKPGYHDESSGPGFPAYTKYGDPLPPGEYLAVPEIQGLSERLQYPVTVE